MESLCNVCLLNKNQTRLEMMAMHLILEKEEKNNRSPNN